MKGTKRILITLACVACGSRNYRTTRKTGQTQSLELNKFCPSCKSHTLHRETK